MFRDHQSHPADQRSAAKGYKPCLYGRLAGRCHKQACGKKKWSRPLIPLGINLTSVFWGKRECVVMLSFLLGICPDV